MIYNNLLPLKNWLLVDNGRSVCLKKNKKYAKATHNTWAVLLSESGPIKNDDGEAGAGIVIVKMLEREQLFDHVIIVTRWFGGVQLGGDRFRRVKDCVNFYLEKL